jgi:DNA polymerase II
MKHKGFIVYPTYKIEDGKAYVYLFGRLENGESFLTMNLYRPYFFIKTKDQKKAGELLKLEYEETDFKDFNDNKVTKVTLDIPGNMREIKQLFSDNDIASYEADIRFPYRYLIDKDLKSTIEIEGTPIEGRDLQPAYFQHINKVFKEPKLTPTSYFPKLKVLSIDIETNGNASELYSIGCYSEDFKKVLMLLHKDYRYKEPKLENTECFTDEGELLKRFKEIILWHDPDILTGWNFIDFDLKVLKERFELNNVDFKFGRVPWDNKLRIQDSFFRDSTAEIPGRIVLDGIQLLKVSFVKLEDYKLSTAAEKFLGEKKLIENDDRVKEIQRQHKEDPQSLANYNLNDAKLAYDIIHKSKTLDLSITRSMLTRMQLDRVKASIASFDNLYLKELQNRNLVASSSKTSESEERIKGGFVMDSKPGIYDNILVFDFKSLYPSIIRTFNIDPVSYVDDDKLKTLSKKEKNSLIKAPNGAHFKNEDGILPQLIQHLFDLREKAKKEKNELESNAIKILMNSFFGIIANQNCRFYSLEIANAITHFGQHIIKLSREKVEELGHEVIYGDTDSFFVNPNTTNYEEAEKIGNKIQKHVEGFYKKYTEEEYNRKSSLEVKFEYTFKKFFLPRVRGSDKGAKKRYAGVILENGQEKTKYTGLEMVRRDWTQASKKLQLEVLDLVFKHKGENDELKDKIAKYIKEFIIDLKEAKYDELLVYKKAIRKSTEEYVKTTPPHIKAARKIGRTSPGLIEYVMTTDGPEVITHKKHEIDYDHYINKQLKPIADSVLDLFGLDLDELFAEHKQTTLSGF